MFNGAINFDQDLSGWNITNLSPYTLFDFFEAVTLSTEHYDALLVSWTNQIIDIEWYEHGGGFDAGNSQYTPNSLAQASRDVLINTYGWDITDGGPADIQP